MASVERRQQRRSDGSLSPVSYRVTWRDPSRRQRSKTFAKRADADRFARTVEVDIDRGQYIDPASGRTTFGDYAGRWLAAQVVRPSTMDQLTSRLTTHIMPAFADKPLSAIQRSDVQAWVKALATTRAPGTVRGAHTTLSSILSSAVDDRLIPSSPVRRISLPKDAQGQLEPLRAEEVRALIAAAAPRWRAYVVAGAGLGLRQGELLGLSVDRVDFLRRTVRVDRQLVTVVGGTRFGPPKTTASIRTVPLPQSVADELAAHLARFGEGPDRLIFTTPAGEPVTRAGAAYWMRQARAAADLPATVTSHALRHFYASLLIAQGQSVKVVQNRLGHRSAVETLDTYGHLWPDSEEDTMAAVDGVLTARVASLLPEAGEITS